MWSITNPNETHLKQSKFVGFDFPPFSIDLDCIIIHSMTFILFCTANKPANENKNKKSDVEERKQ